MAALSYPFQSILPIEALVLMYTALACFLLFLLLLKIGEELGAGSSTSFWVSAGIIFATPLWHYSRSFFTETWAAIFLVAYFYLLLQLYRQVQ